MTDIPPGKDILLCRVGSCNQEFPNFKSFKDHMAAEHPQIGSSESDIMSCFQLACKTDLQALKALIPTPEYFIIRAGINDINWSPKRKIMTRKDANKELLKLIERFKKEHPTASISYQLIKHPLLRWWDRVRGINT